VSLVLDAGGTGDLANGQLTINITGSAMGCGYTYPMSLTFTGSRTSTNPTALMATGEAAQPLTAGSDTIGGAIVAELARLF
jgi:hypothetical protein